MPDNVLDFKVNLEPQIDNLNKIKDQLSSAVKEVGDKDLSQQFLQIENKIKSIQNTMDSFKDHPMPVESFKIINKNISDVLRSMQKLGSGLSSAFGDNSFKTVEKIDQQIEQLTKDIETSANKLKQYKKIIEQNDATGQVQLKRNYENAIIASENIHGFKKNGEMSQSKVASRDNLEKIRADIMGRANQTPEMKTELAKIDQVLSKLDTTLNNYTTKFTQESEHYKSLQQEKSNLESTREQEITKAEANSTKIDNLDAKQAEIQKLNIDILTAQTQNKVTGQKGGGGSGGGGDDPTKLDKAATSVQNLNKQFDKQPSKIGQAVKSFISYTAVIGTLRRAIRSAVRTVRTLDKALTEQAMVSGRTREQIYGLLKSYQNIAMESGATTKEVAQVATQYFRQGKTAKDALTLTEAAVKAAKVASISTADSVDYLTTAINGFKMAAEDAMTVSDKFSALAASSATSYEELAIALSKVASQANLAGMSMDYTLGLLAKGIETTREAPETIGTALKTVIARMREMGDYGETLEGDTTINNVEQQLQYVGIELRNQQGELRSTEVVLDELGQKWDKLNANQQAAIAKALAGTRQQSRLISMMQDYGRTMELVQISERSAGATAAQADTYMQGMEASLNKITVAWEKFTTAFTQDGSFILDVLNTFGDALNKIAEFGSTLEGQRIIYSALALAIGSLLMTKMSSIAATYAQEKAEKQLRLANIAVEKSELQLMIVQKEAIVKDKAQIVSGLKKIKVLNSETKNTLEAAAALYQKNGNQALANNLLQQANKETGENLDLTAEITAAQQDYDLAVADLNANRAKSVALEKESIVLNASLKTGILQYIPVIGTIIPMVFQLGTNIKILFDNTAKGAIKAQAAMGVFGVVLAAIAAILTIVMTSVSSATSKLDKTVADIKEFNGELNHLNQTATAIDTAIAKYEALDHKIIKTTEDIKAMQQALDAAAEKLTESEKEVYDSLDSAKLQYQYLLAIKDRVSLQRDAISTQVINLIKEKEDLLGDAKYNASIYQAANKALEDRIDKLVEIGDIEKKNASNTEKFAKQMLAAYSPQEILDQYVNVADKEIPETKEAIQAYVKDFDVDLSNDQAKKVQEVGLLNARDLFEQWNLTDEYDKILKSLVGIDPEEEAFNEMLTALDSLEYQIKGKTKKITDILLNGEDYNPIQVIDAIEAGYEELPEHLREKFKDSEAVKNWDGFINFLEGFGADKDEVKEALSKVNFNINDFNDFFTNISELVKANGDKIEEGEIRNLFRNLVLGEPGDAQKTVTEFLNYLGYAEDAADETTQDIKDTLTNTVGNFLSATAAGGFQALTQEADKFMNTIASAYEKAGKWSEMSESDKSNFLNDHPEFAQSEKLMTALVTGQNLEEAFLNDKNMQEWRDRMLAQYDQEIASLELEGYYGKAWLLKQEKERLQNMDTLYKDSLKNRLEKEKDYLEQYRSLRERQVEELTKSLNKQKEAYEKYFEAINKDIKDQDWFEQQQLLIDNLTKLSGATDATSMNKMASLQESIEQNLKEREKELRERAQEALVQSIDDEVEKIEQTLEDEFAKVEELLQKLIDPNGSGRSMLQEMLQGVLTSDDKTNKEKVQEIGELLSMAAGQGINTDNIITYEENEDNQTIIINIDGIDASSVFSQDFKNELVGVATEKGLSGAVSNSSNS